MIEAYSKDLTVNAGATVPLNTVKINKGRYESFTGSSSIQFNHCGVYRVAVNGTVTGSDAGVIEVGLEKNGSDEVNTVTQITAVASTMYPFAFTTFVQVPPVRNCACGSPTIISLKNIGIAATFNTVNVCIDKVM